MSANICSKGLYLQSACSTVGKRQSERKRPVPQVRLHFARHLCIPERLLFVNTLPSSTQKLHYTILFLDTIRLLSCKYEPLTHGNRLNPNHVGSSPERDVPKQSSHVKHATTDTTTTPQHNTPRHNTYHTTPTHTAHTPHSFFWLCSPGAPFPQSGR